MTPLQESNPVGAPAGAETLSGHIADVGNRQEVSANRAAARW
jgi:hypothetical protein